MSSVFPKTRILFRTCLLSELPSHLFSFTLNVPIFYTLLPRRAGTWIRPRDHDESRLSACKLWHNTALRISLSPGGQRCGYAGPGEERVRTLAMVDGSENEIPWRGGWANSIHLCAGRHTQRLHVKLVRKERDRQVESTRTPRWVYVPALSSGRIYKGNKLRPDC